MALIASQGLAWLAEKIWVLTMFVPWICKSLVRLIQAWIAKIQRMDGSRWQPAFAILSVFIFPLSLVIIPMDFTVQVFAYTYGLSLIVSIILAVILSLLLALPFGLELALCHLFSKSLPKQRLLGHIRYISFLFAENYGAALKLGGTIA
jgi:hypothetical protein